MALIYLSRHAQTFENLLNLVLNPPSVRTLIDQAILREMDYNYSSELSVERRFLSEGRVKFARLNYLLQEQDLKFNQLYEHAEGIRDYDGNIISKKYIREDTYLPLLNITGVGTKQAQVLGRYLKEVDLIYLTSPSFRTHQTAMIVAHSKGDHLRPGKTFFPEPELQECFPMEYILMDLVQDPHCPFEVKINLNRLFDTSLEKYHALSKEEARRFFETNGKTWHRYESL